MSPSSNSSVLPSLRRTATINDICAALDEVGAVIVADLVDGAVVDRLRDDLGPWIARTSPGSRSDDPEWQQFHGANTVRFNGVAAKTSAFVDVCLDPTILGVADRRLIPDGGSTQIGGTQVISIGPGEPGQYLHRDQTLWPWFNRYLPDGPEVTVLAMLALSDTTEANGATRIVPESHRWPTDQRPEPDAATIPAEMGRGSVLLYPGSLWHGGGANATDQVRIGLNLEYAAGWVRQQENQYLVVPPERTRDVPEHVLRVLGYNTTPPFLGYVDARHPLRWLDREKYR